MALTQINPALFAGSSNTTTTIQSNGTTAMTIDSSQNVGVGTTTPTATGGYDKAIDLVGGSNGAGLYIRGATNPSTVYASIQYDNYSNRTNINAVGTSNFLRFVTVDTERMRIDSSGNVGIGTSSPSALLSIKNSGMSSTLLLGSNTSNSNYGSISFNGSNADGGRIGWTAGGAGNNNLYYDVPSSGEHIWRYGSGSTEAMRINTSGKLVMATSTYGLNGQLQVGITANTGSMNSLISVAGDQNGGYPIGVRGNSTTQGLLGFFDSSNTAVGSITKSGSNVAYNTSSDYRLKENIAPMTGALAKVTQLKPVTYKWKADGTDGQGFVAHELQEVVPDCVTGEKDAVDADGKPVYQGIDVSFLVATLTAAIQELKAINDTQAVEIAALKAK